jgi:SAM-dependent methyltransferase
MALDPDSLERLVPSALDPADAAARETLALHVERYAWAARAARPGRLLDCACGVGYGTEILLRNADVTAALGVDVSPDAIAHANAHFASPRARFVVGDALALTDAEGFDTIVSLETIEHVAEPEALVAHFASLLRPGGRLVASVPTTPSVDLNPHHLHDFTQASFRALGARHGLVERDAFVQVQRLGLGSAWRGRRFTAAKLRPNLPAWYARHPDALVRRLATTLRHGLANHYLTICWERSHAPAGAA